MADLAAPPPRIRVGVAGSSYWAWWCHGTVLARHPGVDFVGFWARRREVAEGAVEQVGAGDVFADLDQLLDRVDLLAVALPPDVQPGVAVRAARAGKHLLLEKPLAFEPPAARKVAEAVRESNVHGLVFLTYLYHPTVVTWLDEMADLARRAGPWEGAIVSCAGGIGGDDSPYRGSSWRWERGGLWDLGPHGLSIASALLSPVYQVIGTRGVRDAAHVLLNHETGAATYLSLTLTAPPGAEEASVEIWGPGGRHRLSLPSDSLREVYARAVDDLLHAIGSGAQPLSGVESAVESVDILYAAESAINAGTSADHLGRVGSVAQ
jgi:predicted dehydrogenase